MDHPVVGEARGWYTGCTGRLITGVIPDCPLAPSKVKKNDGFVAIEIGRVTYYSCYFSTNWPLEEFNAYITRLEGSTSRRGKVVVAGNFNIKCKEWFACCTDKKVVRLSEFVTSNRLIARNNSTNPPSFHQRFGSHIDMTFASKSLARQIKAWALEEESKSDHNYIRFAMERWTMVVAPKKVGDGILISQTQTDYRQ